MDDGITIPEVPRDAATIAREAAALCAAASPETKIRTEARRSIMGRVWSWLST